jgi:hypothetical protein
LFKEILWRIERILNAKQGTTIDERFYFDSIEEETTEIPDQEDYETTQTEKSDISLY